MLKTLCHVSHISYDKIDFIQDLGCELGHPCGLFGCDGILHYIYDGEVYNSYSSIPCSCFISPPCSACSVGELICATCNRFATHSFPKINGKHTLEQIFGYEDLELFNLKIPFVIYQNYLITENVESFYKFLEEKPFPAFLGYSKGVVSSLKINDLNHKDHILYIPLCDPLNYLISRSIRKSTLDYKVLTDVNSYLWSKYKLAYPLEIKNYPKILKLL